MCVNQNFNNKHIRCIKSNLRFLDFLRLLSTSIKLMILCHLVVIDFHPILRLSMPGRPSLMHHNDPKFLDRQLWANCVDPDQTAPLIRDCTF